MPDYDQTRAECFVFTYKEGLLSAIAHDLKLRVSRFAITIDLHNTEIAINAQFDASSLRVETAMRDGVEARSLLSESDKQKIERTIADDVLVSRKYPEITFRSSKVTRRGELAEIRGDLSLFGTKRSVSVDARVDGERWIARVPIHQPDYGMKPYTAMLGTLKIKPDVSIQVSLPYSN